MSVNVAPPCGSVFMLTVHVARLVQMGAPRQPVQVGLARSERAADVLQHRQRPRTAPVAPRLAAQADQALVFRLVVPVRQEDGHQRQRVGVDARGGRHLGEFMKRPASALGRLDLLALELSLDRDPLEVHRRVVVQALGEHLLRADQRHQSSAWETGSEGSRSTARARRTTRGRPPNPSVLSRRDAATSPYGSGPEYFTLTTSPSGSSHSNFGVRPLTSSDLEPAAQRLGQRARASGRDRPTRLVSAAAATRRRAAARPCGPPRSTLVCRPRVAAR